MGLYSYQKLTLVGLVSFVAWYIKALDEIQLGTFVLCFCVPIGMLILDIATDPAQLAMLFSVAGFIAWGYFGKNSLISFLSGGFGGVCLVLVGHPMDLVKVKLQTSSQYSGMIDCVRKILKDEGIGGLYKGIIAPLVGTAPVFAICFWGYGLGKDLVLWSFGKPADVPLTLLEISLAGGFSAIPTTVLMTPMERIKCLLQVDKNKYKGMVDCASAVIKEGGLSSLFKGWDATLLRDIPGSVAYFFVYEVMLALFGRSLWAALCAGGLAGIANWLVCIPLDTLKTRLQTAPEGKYSGLGDVFSEVMKHEGFLGLYTGITPVIIRAFPANAACFFGVEVAKRVVTYFGL